MARHRLQSSSSVIDSLGRLGEALGYDVVPEFPIEVSKRGQQAIDVVWKYDKEQQFPLFVFEVESEASNSAPNNALKVFSKTAFEKPLFFFHVFLKAGAGTSRLADLQAEFGNRNYQVFNLSTLQGMTLLKAILSQHRRLTSYLDTVALVEAIQSATWGLLDAHDLLQHTEQLGFNTGLGTTLPYYAALSSVDVSFGQDFFRYLIARRAGGIRREDDKYGSYFGDAWSTPIHLALLSCLQPDRTNRQFYEALIRWHECPGPYLKVGPMFGLSMDFDDFLVAYAGPLYGLLCALMKDVEGATLSLADHLRLTWNALDKSSRTEWSHLAIWYLHILASTQESSSKFDEFRRKVNDLGGVAVEFLTEPLGGMELVGGAGELADGRNSEDAFSAGLIPIPALDEFRQRFCVPQHGEVARRQSAIRLAMSILYDTSDSVIAEWGASIVSVLHDKSS